MAPVQAPARMSHQELPDVGHVRVVDSRLDQEAARAAATMPGDHEDIAQPGEGRPVRDEPGEADLLAPAVYSPSTSECSIDLAITSRERPAAQ